jgi:hypothetical protein
MIMSSEKKESGLENPLVETQENVPALDSNLASSSNEIEINLEAKSETTPSIAASSETASSETASSETASSETASSETASSETAPSAMSLASTETQSAASSDLLMNHMDWPIDPNHQTAADLLSKQVSDRDFTFDNLNNETPEIAVHHSNKGLNFLLFLLVVVVGVAGTFTIGYYSSPNREARMKEDAECKVEANTLEQLTKQKSYGSLRIESTPTQAKVSKSEDGGKTFATIRGKTPEGTEIDVLTPATLNNLDINVDYIFKVELEGHHTETVIISRYQWILDGATGAYRFQKTVSLTPKDCTAWYTYNWNSGKSQQFDTAEKCEAEYKKDTAESTACRCLAKAYVPPTAENTTDPKKPANQ